MTNFKYFVPVGDGFRDRKLCKSLALLLDIIEVHFVAIVEVVQGYINSWNLPKFNNLNRTHRGLR